MILPFCACSLTAFMVAALLDWAIIRFAMSYTFWLPYPLFAAISWLRGVLLVMKAGF